MTTITQDELLNYIYKECSSETTTLIQQLLVIDTELSNRFEVLKSSHNKLNKVKLMSPSDRSVDFILNYARQRANIYS